MQWKIFTDSFGGSRCGATSAEIARTLRRRRRRRRRRHVGGGTVALPGLHPAVASKLGRQGWR